MASRISRRSWRSSASFCRMTAYFAIGRATVDKTSRMEQAMTSSRSVKPVSDENWRRETWLRIRTMRNIALSIGLWLDLQRCFACHQRNGLLLRIFGIDLHDGQIRRAWRERLDHDPEQRPASVDAGSIRLARSRNNRLAFLLEDLLHDGDFLRTTREEPAVLHFFHADHRGVVLQQQRDGEEIVHIFHHNAERGRLPGLQ